MSRDYVDKRLREIVKDTKMRRSKGSPPVVGQEHPGRRRREIAPLAPAVQLPRMLVFGKHVYEWSEGLFGRQLAMESRCGELLDRLLGVLAAQPPYLHAVDASRYRALIPSFSRFQLEARVPDLPLRRLPVALHSWVEEVTQMSGRPLTPTLVLDTARFIEAHAYGRDFHTNGEHWEIRPLVEGWDDLQRYELNADRRLKGAITSGFAGLLVRVEVPRSAQIMDTRTKQPVAKEGGVVIEIERCHLSSGFGPEYGVHLEAVEGAPMRHDVAGEFSVLGGYWPGARVEDFMRTGMPDYRYHASLHQVYLPGRWIVATLEAEDRDAFPPTLRWRDVAVEELAQGIC